MNVQQSVLWLLSTLVMCVQGDTVHQLREDKTADRKTSDTVKILLQSQDNASSSTRFSNSSSDSNQKAHREGLEIYSPEFSSFFYGDLNQPSGSHQNIRHSLGHTPQRLETDPFGSNIKPDSSIYNLQGQQHSTTMKPAVNDSNKYTRTLYSSIYLSPIQGRATQTKRNNYQNTSQQVYENQETRYENSQSTHIEEQRLTKKENNTSKHHPLFDVDMLNSKHVKKFPLILVTIQKTHNAVSNEKYNAKLNTHDSVIDNVKYDHTPSYINKGVLNSQENQSYAHTPKIYQHLPYTQIPSATMGPEMTKHKMESQFANDEIFQYSIPHSRRHSPHSSDWKPMDINGFKLSESNFTLINFGQEREASKHNNSNYYPHNIPLNSPLHNDNLYDPNESKQLVSKMSHTQNPNNQYALIMNSAQNHKRKPSAASLQKPSSAEENQNGELVMSFSDRPQEQNYQEKTRSVSEFGVQPIPVFNIGYIEEKRIENPPNRIVSELRTPPNIVLRAILPSVPDIAQHLNKTASKELDENTKAYPLIYIIDGFTNVNNIFHKLGARPAIHDHTKDGNGENSNVNPQASGYPAAQRNVDHNKDDRNVYNRLTSTDVGLQSGKINYQALISNSPDASNSKLKMRQNFKKSQRDCSKEDNKSAISQYSRHNGNEQFTNLSVQRNKQAKQILPERKTMKKPISYYDGYVIFPQNHTYINKNTGQLSLNYKSLGNQIVPMFDSFKKLELNSDVPPIRLPRRNLWYDTAFKNVSNSETTRESSNYFQSKNSSFKTDHNNRKNEFSDYGSNQDRIQNKIYPSGNMINNYFRGISENVANVTSADIVVVNGPSNFQKNEKTEYGIFQQPPIYTSYANPYVVLANSSEHYMLSNYGSNSDKNNHPRPLLQSQPFRNINTNGKTPPNSEITQNEGPVKKSNVNTDLISPEKISNYQYSDSFLSSRQPVQNEGSEYQSTDHFQNQYRDSNHEKYSTMLSETSVDSNKQREGQDIHQMSTVPEALLFVLVSAKKTHPNDNIYSENVRNPTQTQESSPKEIFKFISQESNAKKLLETFYKAEEGKQQKIEDPNAGWS